MKEKHAIHMKHKKQKAGFVLFSLKKYLVFFFLFFFLFDSFNRAAFALPQVSDVESGNVTFEQPDSSTMNITAGNNAVINFKSFDIAQNEAVHFIQPSSSAAVLSRVSGSGPSQIAGLLTANGTLFLVNPNGIRFSPTAQVQVNALVASTLDISTNNFIQGNYIFDHVKDGSYAQVLNEGMIQANQVALLGSGVRNAGVITAIAGTVHLASGDKVTLTTDRMGLICIEINEATTGKVIDLATGEVVKDAVANSGTIEAHQVIMNAQTASDIFEQAVNQTGVVKATSLVEENGVIRLVSNQSIAVSGRLEAQSGEILVSSKDSILVAGPLETIGTTRLEADQNIHVLADLTTQLGDLFLSADYNLDGAGSFLQAAATTIKTLIFGHITISSSGDSTFANIVSCGDLIFKQAGRAVTYAQHPDSCVEVGGSLVIDPGAAVIAGNGCFNVNGSWINLGVFNPGTSTVSLLTQAPATVIGSNVFYNLYVTVPGKIVNFESGQTQTIVGILTLKGEYGNLLQLGSISSPDQWGILALGLTDIAYILVGDSLNVRGPPLKAIHSSSCGNLTNWDLDPYWTGQGLTSLWSDPDNWDTGTAPTAYDIVTFDGVTGTNPNKDSLIDDNFQGTIEKLTIDGYLGTITLGRDLTVTGDLTLASGTFTSVIASPEGAKQSLTITVGGNWSNLGGHFEAGASTVVFYDASKISTILGNNTFYNLTCLTPGKTIVFQANSLTTVENTLTLDGAEDGYITLQSSILAKGSEFGIYINSVSDAQGHAYLDYLNVYYSIAYGPVVPILVNNEYIPAELNIDWDATYTWTGTNSGLWNDAGNWGGTLPLAGGDLVFPADIVSGRYSITNDFATVDMSFKSITISGSTYVLGGNRITISSSITDSAASGGNTINLDIIFAATRTITVTNAAEILTIGGTGIISGAGGVTKAGSGVLVLSGANTYTGTTTLSAGTLNFANGTLGSTGNITFTNGTLQYSSGNTQDISSRIKNSTKAIIIDTNGNDVTFGSIIDSTNTGGLTKNGTGALTLSAANTFTGNVTLSSVTGSILNINNAQALGNVSNRFYINGGTINNTSGAPITLLNYPMSWNGYFTFSGTNDLNFGTGIITLAGGGPSRGVEVSAGTLTIDNVITSAIQYNFSKGGAGMLTLNGANTFLAYTVFLNAGTLNINNATALGNVANPFKYTAGTIDNTSDGPITLLDYPQQWAGNDIVFTGTRSLNMGAGAITILYGPHLVNITSSANTLTFGGDIGPLGGFSLNKLGNGTLALTGANSYTAGITITAGTLNFEEGALYSSGNIVFTGGTLQYLSGNTQDISSRIKNSTGVIIIDTNGNNVTFSGVIDSSNTAGLTKSGSGTLTLSAVNTYTGTTTVSVGTLALGIANSFSSGTVIISSGATLDLAGYNLTSAGGTSFANNGTLKLIGSETVTTPTFNAGSTVEYSATSGSRAIKDWTYINATVKINGSGGTFTLSAALTCAGINIAAGTLDAAGYTIGVIGNWSNSGIFTHNNNTVNFTGTADQTITTNNQSFYNLTLNNTGTSGNDDIIISGTLDVNGLLTITDGDLDVSTNDPNVNLAGGMTIGADGSIDLSAYSGAWKYDGSGTLTDNRVTKGDLKTFTIDGTAAVLTLGSSIKATSITVGADDTLNLGIGSYILELTGTGTPLTISLGGTFNKGTGSTVNYTGTTPTNIVTVAYNNLQFSGATTYSLTGNLTSGNALTGNLTIDSGATLDTVNGLNYGITLSGNWSNLGAFMSQGGTVIFTGTSVSTISGNTTFNNLTCATIDKTLNFASGSTQTVEGILTLTGQESHLIILARSGGSGLDQFNLNVTGSSSASYVSVSNSYATGDAIIANNSFNGGNNTNWSFGKDFSGTVYSDNGLTPIGAGKTVAIAVNGAAASKSTETNASGQFLLSSVEISEGDVIIVYLDGEEEKGCAVSVVLNNDLSGLNIYQNRVIVRHDYTTGYTTNTDLATANNGDTDIQYSVLSNNLTLNAGQGLYVWTGDTYQPQGNVTTTHLNIQGALIAGSNTFIIGGDFTNNGTFTYNTSTVTFNDNTRVSTISGSTTFYNLTSTTAGKTLAFAHASAQTITRTLTIQGTSSNPIALNDTGTGALPKVILQAGAAQDISDVNVLNNDASAGIQLVARGVSTISGTLNWALGSTGTIFTWTGDISTDWNNPLNWDLGIVPSTTDNVVIPPTATRQPTLSGDTTVKNMEVDAGTTITTDGSALNVENNMVVNGTLDTGNSTVTVLGNIATSGDGAIQGINPALIASGCIGTKNTPIDLSVTGTATISAAGMNNMVSVSINGTSRAHYATSISGFVYINGRVDDKLGQSQIRGALQTGASKLYSEKPVLHSIIVIPSGFANISAPMIGPSTVSAAHPEASLFIGTPFTAETFAKAVLPATK